MKNKKKNRYKKNSIIEEDDYNVDKEIYDNVDFVYIEVSFLILYGGYVDFEGILNYGRNVVSVLEDFLYLFIFIRFFINLEVVQLNCDVEIN